MKENNEFMFCLIILMALFFCLSAPAWAKQNSKNAGEKMLYRVPGVTAEVKIDGILKEKAWQEALVLELNYEVEPGENIKPPVKTQVLLVYGAKHLYVGFRAYDPEPSEIRAHVTDRDTIRDDDYVGILLDTFNDSRRAYQFLCNPYGVQVDQVINAVGGQGEWDAIWNSAGKIMGKGYNVEMAIPFSSLRFQGKKGDQVWGIDAVRSYPRSLPHLIGLFPRDRNNNCYLCQAHKVIGFKDAKPGVNLEFDPTISSIMTRERESFPDGKFVKKTGKVETGLTARWSFTPNLTLSATINPDFSHVEADIAQLDVNTQFVLFYPEKRPFFLEGRSIFLSRFWPIYTRTVVKPDWGIKLTGKEGKHAIGFFAARDTVTNFIFPSSQSSQLASLDMKNTAAALRYRYDVGKSSTVGIVVTNREGEDYFNRVAGIDGNLRFTKLDTFSFQYLGSQTRYPQDVVTRFNQSTKKFTGGALDLYYYHRTQHFLFFAHYQDVSTNYRNDVGFADQADNILLDGGASYTWRHNPGHWFTQLSIGGGYLYETDHNKNLLRKGLNSSFNYQGPMQSAVYLNMNIGKRTFMGKEFDDNTLDFTTQVRPSGSLLLQFQGALGDRIDFTNVRAGTRVRLNPAVQYNLGRHLYLQLDHVFERLEVDAGKLYTANLSNIRLVYQFSRRAFLRTILQYANYQYNTQLYSVPRDPEFKHLFSQVLFSYKINPQTVLFLGYSDDYYGYMDIPFKQNNYTLFLKIGYALVL